jgi:hypothetical protein
VCVTSELNAGLQQQRQFTDALTAPVEPAVVSEWSELCEMRDFFPCEVLSY